MSVVDRLISQDELWTRARASSAIDVAEKCGAVLRGSRTGWLRARRCPLCEGKNDFSVSKGGFRCHKCGEKGDAIALWKAFAGCSAFVAACELAGFHVDEIATRENVTRAHADKVREDARRRADLQRERAARAGDADDDSIERARRLWDASRPASNTIVVRYLMHRGATRLHAEACAARVRFHARVPWYDPEIEGCWPRGPDAMTPAMIAPIQLADGRILGVHVTHLAEDGRGKANLRPAKKMHGLTVDECGAPGGVLLVAPSRPTDALVVGEGIENALAGAAAAVEAKAVTRGAGVYAALSLDRLQGGMGRGVWGGVDWRRPTADPLLPAATIPHRGPALIVVDHDMAPITVDRGTRFEKVITGTRRAQVCGQLAAHWWKRAGASDVKIMLPPQGADMTDLVGVSG